MNDTFSSHSKITWVVPQDSVLEPLLFGYEKYKYFLKAIINKTNELDQNDQVSEPPKFHKIK